MKINPEIINNIHIIKQDQKADKKTQGVSKQQQKIADVISLENKHASKSHVDNVDQAKTLLSKVLKDLPSNTSGLYDLNLQQVMSLFR
ncbi:MAG: hypothetical protein J7L53_00330 [Deltaproteobacteria bacterium]|nr:hypothetical protein [Deltaproteobacteria bacterium]